MIIAWDFDGVLNRNQADGHYVWETEFEQRTGQTARAFGTFVFGRAPRVITGEIDILERLREWTATVPCKIDAGEILHFWLEADARPDPEMLALVDDLNAAGTRQVIATNNDPRRTAYIANEMGMSGRVERIFASGNIGIAKPDTGYFRHITDALETTPSNMFFVDDLKANVDAAVEAGWQGYHFTLETRDALIDKLRPTDRA